MSKFVDRQSANPGRFKMTLKDGTAYYVTLERADNPIIAGTPLNAATLNAMVESMCGYSDARNLLDNSNFKNPVNQRGGDLYTGGGYVIDRWYTASALSVCVEDGYIAIECDSSASGRNGIAQYLAPEKTPKPGTTVTVAYNLLEDGDEEVLKVETATMPTSGSVNLGSASEFGIRITTENGISRVSMMVPSGETVNVEWIAMYEGTFTAEDLPDYRPKDFSAELMECMRYYQVRSSGNVKSVDLRPTMRATPTVSAREDGLYGYSADL